MDLLRHHRRLTRSVLAGVAAIVALGGCFPTFTTVERAEPEGPVGPTFVVDVTNASNEEQTVSYEYEAGNSSGGGEGSVIGCERTLIPFGPIGGSYTVLVNGKPAGEATLPANLPDDRFVLVRVTIAADGTATTAAPAFLAQMPPVQSESLPGCT
jgi:hypothetical protein